MRATLFLLMTTPALAADLPACTPAQLGAVACLAGRLCECRYERGGSITGLPHGVRWNCSILHPACGEALAPPGIPPPLPTPLPQPLLHLPAPEQGGQRTPFVGW